MKKLDYNRAPRASFMGINSLRTGAISALATIMIAGCGGGSTNTSTPPPAVVTPPPPVTAEKFFDVKNCINIGNALEAPTEGDFDGYVIRPQDMQIIASAGFDTVRIPVRWDTHALIAPPYTIDRAYFDRVAEVIGQAQTQGLKVILDLHHFEDLLEDLDGNSERYLSLWEQIAGEFVNLADDVYFEPFNEPVNDGEMDKVNALYAQVYDIIRATHPTRPIILGGNRFNSIDTLGDVAFPIDPNMVATFHDYSPFEFTHQGVQFGATPPPLGRTWGSAADYADLDDVYTIAATFQASTDEMPVFVGEYGVTSATAAADLVLWLTERRKRMDEQGIIGCAFNFTGVFGLYDTGTESWDDDALQAVLGTP